MNRASPKSPCLNSRRMLSRALLPTWRRKRVCNYRWKCQRLPRRSNCAQKWRFPMSLRSYISFSVLATLLLASSEGLRSSPAQANEKPSKALTGYTVIYVEKFAVGTLSTQEGFPQDFEKVMQKLAVEKLTASKLFENVTDVSEASAAASSGAPAPAEE